jgi:Xaa-Pro aminopeptidase
VSPDAATLSAARAGRLQRVREEMATAGTDALLLSLGADMPWLCGYEAMPLERPTVLIVTRDGPVTLVVPALEAPRVEIDESLFRLRPWAESEDPIALVAAAVAGAQHVAVSDRMWAGLLLSLQSALGAASFTAASALTGPLRAVKDEIEVAALLAAGAAADEVASALVGGEIALIGRSEAEVSREITARLLAAGHARVNFAIVGSGPNAASPHHEAGARRIAAGETVVCDFGGSLHLGGDVGYCSDITRTVVTGPPSDELAELYSVLETAQAAAVAAVAPGVTCAAIDRAGREIIEAAGYGPQFLHRIGHGIGIEEHEDPYMVATNPTPLVSGHAFSVEPGIYLAGRMGARLEDIVVATAAGPLACNRVAHGLAVVEA